VFVCIPPEKAVPEMTYTMSGGTLNPTHSLTHLICSPGDTSNNEPCGKCSSCITTEFTFDEPDDTVKSKAVEFMKKADIDLVCRKQTPRGGFTVYKFAWNIPKHMQVS